MKPGDYVYYYNEEYGTVPARVLAVKTRIKITGNFPEGDREVWVNKSSLEMQ